MLANETGDIGISVVIPCLNEEEGIGQTVAKALKGIAETRRRGEVIVVDNGSTDRSAAIAEEAGARVISEPRRGYGNAYLTGFAAARGEVVVMGDADGTYDFLEIPRFLEGIDAGADLVMGSRRRGHIHRGAMPVMHRLVGNPFLTGLMRFLFRVDISDAYCGMRAIRLRAYRRLELQSIGMEFACEMVIKSAKRGLAISEIPIELHPRAGDSKLNTFRDGWRTLRLMLVYSPGFLFLVPGGVLLLLGLVILAALAGGPVRIFGRVWHIHAMILGSTLALVGAQIVQLGLFARFYAVLYLKDRGPLLERLWRRIRLEHGLVLGTLVFLAGASILVAIFVSWANGGFGRLNQEHQALFGLTLVGLGVQTIFGSFFLSILGLRQNLLLGDREPAGVENVSEPVGTGI